MWYNVNTEKGTIGSTDKNQAVYLTKGCKENKDFTFEVQDGERWVSERIKTEGGVKQETAMRIFTRLEKYLKEN